MAAKLSLIALGPQRLEPTLADAVADLGIAGKIAVVTAGWQEREGEDDELSQAAGGRTVNLELYRRYEEILADDPVLFEAHRRRQDQLKELQGIYKRRLDRALAAWSDLMELDDGSELVRAEREDAMRVVRELDSHHLRSLQRVHDEFAREARPAGRRVIVRHRTEIDRLLAGCRVLAVAGGHVAVLLNRMRLFGLLELSGERPIIAWSAGIMALSERVVVFHDNPPQGAGNAEVLESGLGKITGLVPLPHARRRLRLSDARRVQRLVRRFEPALCVALDEGDRLAWNGEGWRALKPARLLMSSGAVQTVEGPLGVGR
jgi:hypothetical protein